MSLLTCSKEPQIYRTPCQTNPSNNLSPYFTHIRSIIPLHSRSVSFRAVSFTQVCQPQDLDMWK